MPGFPAPKPLPGKKSAFPEAKGRAVPSSVRYLLRSPAVKLSSDQPSATSKPDNSGIPVPCASERSLSVPTKIRPISPSAQGSPVSKIPVRIPTVPFSDRMKSDQINNRSQAISKIPVRVKALDSTVRRPVDVTGIESLKSISSVLRPANSDKVVSPKSLVTCDKVVSPKSPVTCDKVVSPKKTNGRGLSASINTQSRPIASPSKGSPVSRITLKPNVASSDRMKSDQINHRSQTISKVPVRVQALDSTVRRPVDVVGIESLTPISSVLRPATSDKVVSPKSLVTCDKVVSPKKTNGRDLSASINTQSWPTASPSKGSPVSRITLKPNVPSSDRMKSDQINNRSQAISKIPARFDDVLATVRSLDVVGTKSSIFSTSLPAIPMKKSDGLSCGMKCNCRILPAKNIR